MSAEVESRYQTKLQQKLQEMRADFDVRIACNREEMEALYANKRYDYEDEIQKLREHSELLCGSLG